MVGRIRSAGARIEKSRVVPENPVYVRIYFMKVRRYTRIRNAIMDDRWMKNREEKRKRVVISILRWIFRDIKKFARV